MRVVFFLMVLAGSLSAQQPVLWRNPSFEDKASHSHPPYGWFYCDEAGESPPDIHPGGFFGVEYEARDGRTYLGMVVRDNGTTEGVGQRLTGPLQPGQCYALEFYAARSLTYESISRVTGKKAVFSTPVKLLLWAGNSNCDKAVLLAQSKAIESASWEKHTLLFEAEVPYTHLFLEAAHLETDQFYNGNILMDQLSPILPAGCRDRQIDAEGVLRLTPNQGKPHEAEDSIAKLLDQVMVDVSGAIEEKAVVRPDRGYIQLNPYLWQAGCLLRQFPNLKLELGIAKNLSRPATEQLQRMIWYSLQVSGAPSSQYRIRGQVGGYRWKGEGGLRYKFK